MHPIVASVELEYDESGMNVSGMRDRTDPPHVHIQEIWAWILLLEETGSKRREKEEL